MSAGQPPLGVLRPAGDATLASAARAPVDIPMREPLRWLTASLADRAGGAGGSAAAAADAAAPSADGPSADDGDLVYVDFSECDGVQLDAGASYEFAGLDTDAPTLRLADGSTFVGRWEEAIGTCVVFTDEPPAADAPGALRRVQHAGHTETRLVMRRAPDPHLPPLPPSDAAAANDA